MGLRTKTALVIALTTALAATVIGFLVHHRTAENQQQNARTAVDDLLVEALHDVAPWSIRRSCPRPCGGPSPNARCGPPT
ncbi:hypothetical protein ACFCY8_24475 [Streptomyces noursei]|uniref:hypothetical protein n=1 Tax=Streptomyces noursei TaxID=1971 RepID=UPI0035E2127B